MPRQRREPSLESDRVVRAAAREGRERRALDERLARLGRELDRTGVELQRARTRLAQVSGGLGRAAPGFRPLQSRDEVLPFRDAARRYLLAAAQLFAGDPRGLSRALGVSYFALRRLLARYDVPIPAARPRR